MGHQVRMPPGDINKVGSAFLTVILSACPLGALSSDTQFTILHFLLEILLLKMAPKHGAVQHHGHNEAMMSITEKTRALGNPCSHVHYRAAGHEFNIGK